MVKKRRLRIMAVLVIVLSGMVLLAGCEKDQVAETGPGYDAKQLNAKVWASIDSSQPNNLLLLSDSAWYRLVGVRMVTTDSSGQAQLRGPDCTDAYVYQNSALSLSPCSKGGGTGNCAIGATLSKNCDISIRTMPADVEPIGTWSAVIYLEESQVTLVIVGEGAVAVTPATKAEFELVDREPLQFEVFTRELGQEVPVEAENGEPRLLYTASDGRLEELRERLGELPPARESLGMEALPVLRDRLSQLDPMLNVWVDEIEERAARDDIQLWPDAQVPSPLSLTIEESSNQVYAGECGEPQAVDIAATVEGPVEEVATARLTYWWEGGQEISARMERETENLFFGVIQPADYCCEETTLFYIVELFDAAGNVLETGRGDLVLSYCMG